MGRDIPLFWRLFVPNATVLAVASVILMVQPPNGRIPVLIAGLAVMLAVNLILMRRAFAPLARLTEMMGRVDPLRPGQRLPAIRGSTEVVVLTEAFNDMLDRLESERRESGRRALMEREDERRSMATELHDGLGQTLTAIGLQLDRLADRLPREVRPEVAEIHAGVLETVEDTRRLARQLRPEALDALGLAPALANLTQRLTHQTGLQVVRRIERDLPRLSSDAELVVFRVAQESLTNALRHARASTVELELRSEQGDLILQVCDDGVGIAHVNGNGNGTGIRAMRERALLVGAELSIGSRQSGPGTEVLLRLPADAA